MMSRDEVYMKVAETLSEMSTCQRAQVGCIITLNKRIVSTGWNGPLKFGGRVGCSVADGCDLSRGCDRAIHAESNAIFAAAKLGIPLKGATLYCVYSPCVRCSEAIIQSGITKVVFKTRYRDATPLNKLTEAGVVWDEIKV